MTKANFMNLSSAKANFTAHMDSSQKLQENGIKTAEIFAGYMNQSMNQMKDVSTSKTKDTASADLGTKDTVSAAESYERYSYKQNKIDSVKETDSGDLKEELEELFGQVKQGVMDTICEEYGVSEEEINTLLADMGLQVLDLLNPENLADFIMQLTDTASGEVLLLEDSFLQVMGTMDALAEGLTKELHVDKNGLQELVNQMETVNEDMEIPGNFQQNLENVKVYENSSAAEKTISEENGQVLQETQNPMEETLFSIEENVQTMEEVVQTAEKTFQNTEETAEEPMTEEVEVQKEDTDSDIPKNTVQEEVSVEKVEVKQEQGTFAEEQKEGEQSLFDRNSTPENIVTTQTDTSVNATANTAETSFHSYLSDESLQIMKQVVQQMRVHISAETTSMEMQLNPENLGKVYVNISSEKGVVNAHFHATSEAVKEVLETQIATLRENLNQAGVKVDAIEVTIASHEFERNLEQNHHNSENHADMQEDRTARNRNISMDSIDELAGEMTEGEMLAAQIMKDNGNSIDFTA